VVVVVVVVVCAARLPAFHQVSNSLRVCDVFVRPSISQAVGPSGSHFALPQRARLVVRTAGGQ
jgi:hypothetical protein